MTDYRGVPIHGPHEVEGRATFQFEVPSLDGVTSIAFRVPELELAHQLVDERMRGTPVPEPVEETAPEPVEETAPEPVEETVPEPVEETAPEPVEETAPEPVEETAPEPANQAPQPRRKGRTARRPRR